MKPSHAFGRDRSGQPVQVDPVETFLRLCLRSRWHPASLAEARSLAAAPDWDWEEVLSRAAREAVSPLLHRALRKQALAPAQVEARLANVYRSNAVRNLLLAHELAELLDTFTAAGIEVVALKGVALAETVYSDPGLRVVGDADLLVREETRPSAIAALEAKGYARSTKEVHPDFRLAHDSELAFARPDGRGPHIDLHWSLMWPHYYRQTPFLSWLWETSQVAAVGGARCLVLGHDAQFLHLAGHLWMHHQGRGLRWWADLAEIASEAASEPKWDSVLAEAEHWGLALSVRSVLDDLAARWQVPVPSVVLNKARRLRVSAEEKRTFVVQAARGQRLVLYLWNALGGMSAGRDRLCWILGLAFPSRAYMRERYGVLGSLLPLAYPYRLIRGLRRLTPP